MKKIIATAVLVASLLTVSIAAAQSYGYVGNSMTCANLSSNLSIGSRSTQVRTLQAFISNQNYPGGGSWMVTGYYGQATAAGVRIFQSQHGLPQTGIVDTVTRNAINQSSCGGISIAPTPSYTTNPFGYNTTYPAYPYNYNGSYPYNTYYPYNNYNNCYSLYSYNANCNYGTVTLNSLSPQSGSAGTQVTIWGSGFDYASNNVYIGGTTLRDIPSNNGTSLVFTVPSNLAGLVSVSVGNTRGTSNALTFQSTDGYSNCGVYPYNCGCNGYNCPPPAQGQVSISFLSPQSGAVGTTVTVLGYGFSREGNTVHFGNGIIANLRSFDGTSLSFTVPSQLSGYGYQPIGLGSYDVSVSNQYGATSNVMRFMITSINSTTNPTIGSVTGPTTLNAGQTGTWTISVNAQSGTQLTATSHWGDEVGLYMSAPQSIYASSNNQVTFTHAYQNAGTYTATFTVTDANGHQNTSSITVNVGGSATTGNTILNYLSPNAGHVGIQVQLQGSGFSSFDNTVHFGVGGTQHLPSYNNGTVIYFTIPSYVSPCDVQSTSYCTLVAQQVTTGSYPIYVSNSNGTSQTLSFIVN